MRRSGGRLVIRLWTSDEPVDAQAGPPEGPPGSAVLEVRDTGHGIDPSVIAHIFEPFFTTRDVGEGTGLGLSVVHGIVTSMGGAITVESAVGQGATFRVYLPIAPSVVLGAAIGGKA
jgi:signal transduction histidine kinase